MNKKLMKLSFFSIIISLGFIKTGFAQVYVNPMTPVTANGVPYQIWNPSPGIFISTPNPIAAGIVTAGGVFANGINKNINNAIKPNTNNNNTNNSNQISQEQQKQLIEKNQQKDNKIMQNMITKNTISSNQTEKKPVIHSNNEIKIENNQNQEKSKHQVIVLKGMGDWNQSSIQEYSQEGKQQTIQKYEKFLQK